LLLLTVIAVAAAVVVAAAARWMVTVKSPPHPAALWACLGLQLRLDAPVAPRQDACAVATEFFPMTTMEKQFVPGRNGTVAGERHFRTCLALQNRMLVAALATTGRGPNQQPRIFLDM
jgi:hypothetical protein